MPGVLARPTSPRIRQLLIGPGEGCTDQDEFENRLYLIRRIAEIEFDGEVTFPSFSSRTLVYKGLLTAPQLARFYPDLRDPSWSASSRSFIPASRPTPRRAGSSRSRCG